MNRRRSQSSIVANPVLVGAVTVLVLVVAVFLAYNANNGLPFVPTREVKVNIVNGSNLVKGNEVRAGGYRIGVVQDMEPVRLASGEVGAQLDLKLDKKIGALPVDTTVLIRPRSALGLKYVELTKGKSSKTLIDGGTLDATKGGAPVDLDDVINTFDEPTRVGSQQSLQGFGDALTGRGADLNETIQHLPSLLGHLTHVTRQLSQPSTGLVRFFKELGDAARIVAPVAKVNSKLFTDMGSTFAAIDADPKALKDTIAKTPSTLSVATRSLAVQQPFLEHTASFSRDLAGASVQLRAALPTLNHALEIGTPVTKRSSGLYKNLQGSMLALRDLARAPTTAGALRGLTATVKTLQPQIRYLGPYITVCNTFTYFWTFAAEHFSSPSSTGGEQRALFNSDSPTAALDGNDGVGSDSANEFAHGKSGEYSHSTYYGSAVNSKGEANCEAGQNGYSYSANPFRDRALKGDPYKRAVVDHPVGDERVGSTFARLDKEAHGVGRNPDHVPAGETFTVRPGGAGVDTPDPHTYPAP
jgi:virulence factor Mce-like protein